MNNLEVPDSWHYWTTHFHCWWRFTILWNYLTPLLFSDFCSWCWSVGSLLGFGTVQVCGLIMTFWRKTVVNPKCYTVSKLRKQSSEWNSSVLLFLKGLGDRFYRFCIWLFSVFAGYVQIGAGFVFHNIREKCFQSKSFADKYKTTPTPVSKKPPSILEVWHIGVCLRSSSIWFVLQPDDESWETISTSYCEWHGPLY